MNGKVCLVTGATDGIGKVTALALAKMGATVVGVGRDPRKAEAVQAEAQSASGTLEMMTADFSSQEDISTLVTDFLRKHDRLHVLVNNAGAIIPDYRESVDGIEMTFAVNHLSYFLLTNLLLETIIASAPARIVNVASSVHEGEVIDFDNLENKRNYSLWTAYGRSKLANLLFTYELARRLAGANVSVNAVHPGWVNTNFAPAAGLKMNPPLTPEQGAETQIWLASSPDVEGVTGKYFVRKREAKSSPETHDAQVAKRLWDVSAQMVGGI